MKRTAIIAAMATYSWLVLQGLAATADAKQDVPPSAAPPETVVVTGHRFEQKNVDEIVHDFVIAHGALSPKIHQLTRWTSPICPVVRGLPAEFENFLIARVKAIADSVGAPTKDRCGLGDLNVEIIFSPDPQKLLDDIAKSDRAALGYGYQHNQRVPTLTSPIQAWYVTATNNGMWSVIDDPNPINSFPNPIVSRGLASSNGFAGRSRILSPVYSQFVYVLILADTKKVAGYPIGPIADYVAMLALAQAKSRDDCSKLASILDYMSPGCSEKPESLTYADKAYLEGLYSMNKEEKGSFQEGDVSGHMVKELEGK